MIYLFVCFNYLLVCSFIYWLKHFLTCFCLFVYLHTFVFACIFICLLHYLILYLLAFNISCLSCYQNFRSIGALIACDFVFSFSVWGSSTEVIFLSTWTHIPVLHLCLLETEFFGHFLTLDVRGLPLDKRFSCFIESSLFYWIVCLNFPTWENYSQETRKIGINSRRQIIEMHVTPQKIRKERVHREASFESVNLMSAMRPQVCGEVTDDKGSLQQTRWRSSTSSRKVWWLGWISKQSPSRRHGTRSCHSMDSILSVQNKNFSGDGRVLKKVSRAVRKAESHCHWFS